MKSAESKAPFAGEQTEFSGYGREAACRFCPWRTGDIRKAGIPVR